MVRHFCSHSGESFLCCAESRGDGINCCNCPCNEDIKFKNQKLLNSSKESKEKEE